MRPAAADLVRGPGALGRLRPVTGQRGAAPAAAGAGLGSRTSWCCGTRWAQPRRAPAGPPVRGRGRPGPRFTAHVDRRDASRTILVTGQAYDPHWRATSTVATWGRRSRWTGTRPAGGSTLPGDHTITVRYAGQTGTDAAFVASGVVALGSALLVAPAAGRSARASAGRPLRGLAARPRSAARGTGPAALAPAAPCDREPPGGLGRVVGRSVASADRGGRRGGRHGAGLGRRRACGRRVSWTAAVLLAWAARRQLAGRAGGAAGGAGT